MILGLVDDYMRFHVGQVYFIEVANRDDRADDLNCEQRWLKQYNLYAYIKNNVEDVTTIRNECVTDFLDSAVGSNFSQFYTIDSLLQVESDSLT